MTALNCTHCVEFHMSSLFLQHGYLINGAESKSPECGSTPCFVGKHIDLKEIPQYVKEYDRGSDVELWQINITKSKP